MNARIPLFGAIAAVLLAAVFYFLLYQPRVEEQEALAAETSELENQQRTLRGQIAQLESVRDRSAEYDAALAELGDLLPDGVAQPALMRELQATADNAGAVLQSVTFADVVPADPVVDAGDEQQLGVATATMVLEGGYFQQIDFLRRFEQDSPRAVLIRNVVAAEAEDGFPSLSTTVTADFFALIEAEAQPAAGSAGAPTSGEGAVTPSTSTTEVTS